MKSPNTVTYIINFRQFICIFSLHKNFFICGDSEIFIKNKIFENIKIRNQISQFSVRDQRNILLPDQSQRMSFLNLVSRLILQVQICFLLGNFRYTSGLFQALSGDSFVVALLVECSKILLKLGFQALVWRFINFTCVDFIQNFRSSLFAIKFSLDHTNNDH